MLELPTHHATLLSLHSAVEHALVVHLATAGTAGSAIQEEAPAAAGNDDGTKDTTSGGVPTLRIPELISYSALRPLVERSCGRRLGLDELARLVWLWGADAAAAAEGRSNIGFEVTKGTSGGGSGSTISHAISGLTDLTKRNASDFVLGLRMRMDEGDDDFSDDEGDASGRSGGPSVHDRLPPRTPPMKQRVTRTPGSRNDPASPSPSPRIHQGSFLTPGRLASTASPSQLVGSLPTTPPSTFGKRFGSSSPSPARRTREHSGGSEQSFLDVTSDVIANRADGAGLSTSVYARRGISLVALWNNGMRRRKQEVRRRLIAWCASREHPLQDHDFQAKQVGASTQEDVVGLAISVDHGHDADDDLNLSRIAPLTPKKRNLGAIEGAGGLLTPAQSREEGHKPGAKRIKCDPSMLLPGADLDSPTYTPGARQPEGATQHNAPPIPKATLPGLSSPSRPGITTSAHTPPSPSKPTRVEAARIAHRAAIAQTEAALGRPLSLTERIRAKQETARSAHSGTMALGRHAAHPDTSTGLTSASSVAAAARRRANLSRLQDVAEGIYMLFSAGAKSSKRPSAESSMAASPFENPSTTTPTLLSAAAPLPLIDVLRAVCQSSKIPMSSGEARDAIDRLCHIAPGFIDIVPVGARHWVRLLGQVQVPAPAAHHHDHDVVNSEVSEFDSLPQHHSAPVAGVLGAVRRCIRAEMERTTGV